MATGGSALIRAAALLAVAASASIGLTIPVGASPQKPTITFEFCTKAVGQRGPKADLIEPDDFIAICGGGGPVGSPTFVKTWSEIVDRCRKGILPEVSAPLHARGFLTIRGRTIDANIECDRVFDIASKYGVISSAEADQGRVTHLRESAANRAKLDKIKRDASEGVWPAKYFLSLYYLRLVPSPVPVYKNYAEGLNLVESLARSGHGNVVMNYIQPLEERANQTGDTAILDTTYLIQARLAKGGNAAAALRLCEIDVVRAKRNFANPVAGRYDTDHMQQVTTACERAAELNGPAVRGAVDELKKQTALALDKSTARRADAERARQDALLRFAAVIGALILKSPTEAAQRDGPKDPYAEARRQRQRDCKDQQDAIYSVYSAKDLGFANAFMGCP